jgi:VWFA-related protein
MNSIASLLLLAAATGVASVADGQAPPASSFGERVEVSVVDVDVYVTNRRGEPVTGLTREDFLLFEDGEPVAITNFFAVERQPASAQPGAPAAEPAEPEAPATRPAPPPERRTSLVVFVDNVNLLPANRKRAFRALAEFLTGKLAPGTPVMVVSYERSLRVVAPLAADLAPALAAFDRLEKAAPQGVESHAARRNTLIQIRSIYDEEGCEEGLDSMLAFSRAYARPRFHDVEAALVALTQLADSLAGLAGRKVLLHVSDGVPLVAGQEMLELIDHLCPGSVGAFDDAELRASTALRRLTTHANADGVVLYALEALGLQSFTSAGADMPQQTLTARLDFNARANHQDTLFNMADETGGRALLNANRLGRGLDQVAGDLESYYSLGFTPGHQGDGREHTLEVRVRREEVEVRHRKTYRDKPAAERAEERLYAALILGEEENPLRVRLERGGAADAEGGLSRVALVLRVPFPSLALLPVAAGRQAHLRLALVARDSSGGSTPVRRVELPILVPEADLERALAGDFVYEIRLTLRPGAHRLALSVEDTAAAVTSYLRFELEVPTGLSGRAPGPAGGTPRGGIGDRPGLFSRRSSA